MLRALGAPAGFVLLVVRLGTTDLIAAGCLLSYRFGWAGSVAAGVMMAAHSGLVIATLPGRDEAILVPLLALADGAMAPVPAWLATWTPVSDRPRTWGDSAS